MIIASNQVLVRSKGIEELLDPDYFTRSIISLGYLADILMLLRFDESSTMRSVIFL